MDAELAPADRDRLREALAAWRRWDAPLGGAPSPVLRLPGHSNVNVLVTAPTGAGPMDLVVRLDRPAAHLGVDRALEGRVLDRIRGEPWAPRIVHRQPDLCLVTRFEPGPSLSGPDAARGAGALLARIHSLDPSGLPVLDPPAHARAYLDALAPAARAAAEPAVAALVRAFARDGPLAPGAEGPVFAHVDYQGANVIATPRGPVVLDWEYARAAEPGWDLAVFAAGSRLDRRALGRLVDAYRTAGGRVEGARVQRLLDVYGLIEHLWWALRSRTRGRTEAFAIGCERWRARIAKA